MARKILLIRFHPHPLGLNQSLDLFTFHCTLKKKRPIHIQFDDYCGCPLSMAYLKLGCLRPIYSVIRPCIILLLASLILANRILQVLLLPLLAIWGTRTSQHNCRTTHLPKLVASYVFDDFHSFAALLTTQQFLIPCY